MLWRAMTDAGRILQRLLAESSRRLQALRERHRFWTGAGMREARGLALLREWLSPGQLAQFDASNSFDVVGYTTGRHYRIHHGISANVHEIDSEGRPIVGWCFVPSGQLVPGDIMLAQKIALETNEIAAIAVANRFSVQVHLRGNLNLPTS